MKSLIIIAFITTQYLFALVSIAPVEIGEKVGSSAAIEAGLETKRGNTDKDNYSASLRVSYDDNSSFVIWTELSRQYGKSNDVEDTNEAFGHLRFIHALSNNENLRYELFAQLESDDFRQINSRTLGGFGLRYKIFNSKESGKGFFGLGEFYEEIKYLDPLLDPSEKNRRLNSYLAYTLNFSDKSTFSCTLYYQPKIDDFKDYVQSSKLELKLLVFKSLFLKLSASLNRDTNAATGVEELNFAQTTTFVFSF